MKSPRNQHVETKDTAGISAERSVDRTDLAFMELGDGIDASLEERRQEL